MPTCLGIRGRACNDVRVPMPRLRAVAPARVARGRLRAVAVLVIAALLLAGCASTEEGADADPDVAATSPTAIAEAAEPAENDPSDDRAPDSEDDEGGNEPRKAIPLPTADASGRPVGAALLREQRPIPSPVPTSEATPTPAPTEAEATPTETATAPTETAVAEPSATPVPESTDPPPTPVGESGLGALRTPTGVIAGIVGGAEGAWEIVSPCNNTVTVSTGQLLDRPVVLIDPGHGGSETGAVGPAGLTEKELNLNVAKRLEAWLIERDISVLLTRERDYRMALRARTALANAIRPTVFVSIHHNGGSTIDLDTPPTEVFYQEFSAESKRLAGLVYEELERAMTPVSDSWRGTPFEGAQPRFTPSGETLYGILRRSEVPTVISEPFYLDNEHGEGLANDPSVLTIETEALGIAIQRYLSSADPGSGFVEGDSFTLGNSSGGTDGCVDPALE